MLPWGTDQTWDERLKFDGKGGTLFKECLADSGCAAMYRAAAEEVLKTLPTLGLSTKARCAAEALRPFQQAEAEAATPTRVPFNAEKIAARVDAARVFMESRAPELAAWLGVPAPRPDHSEPPCVEPERERVPPPGAVSGRREVHLGRVTVSSGVLTAHLTADSSGSIDLRTTIATRRGQGRVCRRDGQPVAAGFATVRCRLTGSARRRLAQRWSRLRVSLTFTSSDGGSAVDVRHVNVPRTAARRARR
jgi:hypothetical protein